MKNKMKFGAVLSAWVVSGVLSLAAIAPAMADESFAMLTHLKLKPGTEERFMREVAAIVRFSRQEAGNIAWFVQQSKEDPTEIVFYTRWKNQAALDYHLSAEPVARYIARSAELLAEKPRLVKYTPLDLEE